LVADLHAWLEGIDIPPLQPNRPSWHSVSRDAAIAVKGEIMPDIGYFVRTADAVTNEEKVVALLG
jgi:hypothetical protein